MADQLEYEIDKTAYDILLKQKPSLISALKDHLKAGETVKQIEGVMNRRFGKGNIIAQAAISAAYHMQDNPELLK